MSFGFGVSAFKIVFLAVSAVVIGGIITIAVSLIANKRRNDRSPILTVDAEVLSKRTDTSHQRHAVGGDITGAHGFHTMSATTHYVCFRTADGVCAELTVDGDVYDGLAEGDRGKLTYQGTRFLGFSRDGDA